jgi:hypothetical protein
MRRLHCLTRLVVCAQLLAAAPAAADVVTVPPAVPVGRAGPAGLLDIALVHAAMHDAIQSIEGRYRPYHYSDPSRLGIGNPAAAAAAAAHGVLVRLYPGQQASLGAYYAQYLLDQGLAGDPGIAAGEAAALALHTDQYRGPIASPPFFGGTNPGEWRSPVPMGFLDLTVIRPFTLNASSQFRPPPPPPMTSTIYLREYDEVKAIGNSLVHPNATTDVARFWSVNFAPQWNEAMRQIADGRLSIGDSARLFALANLAAADAALAVWESKYFYNFWRPQTGIREGASDGNARTAADLAWTSLIPSPPYPDYVSGANGITGAFAQMLELVFGTDELEFSVRTTSPLATPERFYSRFSDAAKEVVEARILLGIHFRSADEQGRRLGMRVAHWTFTKFLGPLPGSAGN